MHTFVVPVLGHERGLSASVIGTILGAFAMAAAVVRVVLPLLASRVREWAVIAGAMVATALLFAVYPFMHTRARHGPVLGAAGHGAGRGAADDHEHAAPDHARTHRHGEAVGMRLMAINASSVAMPMLFGAAGAVIGIGGVFWVVGAVVAGGTPARRLRLREPLRAGRSVLITSQAVSGSSA